MQQVLPKGSTIGPYPYRLIRRIGVGKGGMAAIYLATVGEDVEHPDPIDLVVIKFSLVDQKRAHDFYARAHSNEVEVLRHLAHPGVVRLYRIRGEGLGSRAVYTARAELPGQPWFSVLEYLSGGSLDDLMATSAPLDVPFVLYVAYALAKALAYVHESGYVHLDVKPENVLFRRPLSQSVEPVLVDFGIARPIGRGGLEGGTPKWMPPERVRLVVDDGAGTETVPVPDPAMDVYALGATLFAMAAGRPPFEATRRRALVAAILNQPPPDLAKLRPEMPAEFVRLVEAMLAKNPADRPRDDEIVRTLRALAPRSHGAVGDEGALAAPRNETPAIPISRPISRPAPPKRSRRFLAALVGAATAVLAAVGVTWWAVQAGVVRISSGVPPTPPGPAAPADASPAPVVLATSPSPTPTLGPTSTPVPAEIAAVPPTATPTPTRTPTKTPRPTRTPAPTNTPAPTRPPEPPNTLGFEVMGTWKRGDQPYGTLTRSSEQVREGQYAARLAYDFPSRQNDFVVFLQERPLEGRPNAIRAWVYGDGQGHFLNVWIRDSAGQTWQVPLGQVTHTGWREMVGLIDPGQEWPWTHISGPDNGRVDYPIRFAALVLDDYPDTFQGKGVIYVDAIRAVELSPEEVADVRGASASAPAPGTGTESVQVTSTPVSGETAGASAPAAGPPLSGYLAFTLMDPATGRYDVYAATPDGSQRWRVATYARQPAISPDSRVAVNGQGGGRDSLWIYNLDGSLPVQVGSHPEDAFPSWSPASNRLVFSSTLQGDGRSRIYTYLNFSPSVEPELFMYGSYEMFGRYPTWFDNWQIAFTGCNYWDTGGTCGLYVLNPNGGLPRLLTNGGTNDLAADYYADQVVFMSNRTGNWDVFIVPFAGGQPRNLTNHPADDGLPTWSPDGQWIAFLSNREGRWAVWAVRPDGSGLRKLFDLNGTPPPDWTNERLSWGP